MNRPSLRRPHSEIDSPIGLHRYRIGQESAVALPLSYLWAKMRAYAVC